MSVGKSLREAQKLYSVYEEAGFPKNEQALLDKIYLGDTILTCVEGALATKKVGMEFLGDLLEIEDEVKLAQDASADMLELVRCEIPSAPVSSYDEMIYTASDNYFEEGADDTMDFVLGEMSKDAQCKCPKTAEEQYQVGDTVLAKPEGEPEYTGVIEEVLEDEDGYPLYDVRITEAQESEQPMWHKGDLLDSLIAENLIKVSSKTASIQVGDTVIYNPNGPYIGMYRGTGDNSAEILLSLIGEVKFAAQDEYEDTIYRVVWNDQTESDDYEYDLLAGKYASKEAQEAATEGDAVEVIVDGVNWGTGVVTGIGSPGFDDSVVVKFDDGEQEIPYAPEEVVKLGASKEAQEALAEEAEEITSPVEVIDDLAATEIASDTDDTLPLGTDVYIVPGVVLEDETDAVDIGDMTGVTVNPEEVDIPADFDPEQHEVVQLDQTGDVVAVDKSDIEPLVEEAIVDPAVDDII